MDERQLRTIENVTANFFFWQGLRWVPLGFALLLSGLFPGRLLFMIAVIGIALWISGRIGTYYSRAYGNVRALSERNVRRELWKWNFVYPLMIVSLVVDGLWKPPLLISGPVWAAAIVLYWSSTGRGRLHYLGVAVLVAATAALPLLGFDAKSSLNLFFGVIGAAYVIGGVLDHIELTRIMRPLVEDGDAGTV